MGKHQAVAHQHLTIRQLTAAVQRHKDSAKRHYMMGAVGYRLFVEPDAFNCPIGFDAKLEKHLHEQFEQWYQRRPKCWEQRVLDDRAKRSAARKAAEDGRQS